MVQYVTRRHQKSSINGNGEICEVLSRSMGGFYSLTKTNDARNVGSQKIAKHQFMSLPGFNYKTYLGKSYKIEQKHELIG